MEKEKAIIIGLIAVVLIILCAIGAYTLMNQNTEVLKINDLNLVEDQFGIYNLKGHITPLKDFDYLEARIVIYDENGVVIGKSSCAWNSAHVKKDDTLSVGNGLGVTCDGGEPAYAVISFFDNVYSEDELANFTVRFDGNATNATDSSNAASSTQSSGSDGKKFTQEDMERAKDNAYWKGYGDSIDDSASYYDDYSQGSSSVETTTEESGQSESSGSWSSSNVETTTDD